MKENENGGFGHGTYYLPIQVGHDVVLDFLDVVKEKMVDLVMETNSHLFRSDMV